MLESIGRWQKLVMCPLEVDRSWEIYLFKSQKGDLPHKAHKANLKIISLRIPIIRVDHKYIRVYEPYVAGHLFVIQADVEAVKMVGYGMGFCQTLTDYDRPYQLLS